MTTLIPLRARIIAVDLPMPLAPPVISATFGVIVWVLSRFAAFPDHPQRQLSFWLNKGGM